MGKAYPNDRGGDPAASCDGRGPLAYWKTRCPARISPAEADELAHAVTSAAILREPRWPAARAGDAATAAGMAIDRIRTRRLEGPDADLVMGNLLLLARRGDPTAPVVLRHAVGALSRQRSAAPPSGLSRRRDGAAGRPVGKGSSA